MRKPIYIAELWGKTVHNICTNCVLNAALCTRLIDRITHHVHKTRQQAGLLALVKPRLVPIKISQFQSVKVIVMTIIHTPYKENNNSKILKSFFLYKGVRT